MPGVSSSWIFTGFSEQTLKLVFGRGNVMIGFGFTIFQFFHTLNEKFLVGRLSPHGPARFGGALIALGIVLLVMAIWYNRLETRALLARRQRLHELGLIRHPEIHKQSATMTIALLTLILGAFAMLSVAFRIGVF